MEFGGPVGRSDHDLGQRIYGVDVDRHRDLHGSDHVSVIVQLPLPLDSSNSRCPRWNRGATV